MINRHIPLIALLSLVAAADAIAAPPKPLPNRTYYQAIETNVSAVTLPSSPQGTLVVIPCSSRAPKTFRVIATSRYLFGEEAVTLREFKAATVGQPKAYVTVIYDEKTNELFSVSASVDPPTRTPPAKADRNRQPAR